MHTTDEHRAAGGGIHRREGVGWSSRATVGNLSTLVWLIPCGLALVYIGVFVAQLPHNIWESGWESDFASGFTLPATLARVGTGGHTVLATYPLYAALWFGLLTAKLPLHRQLWEIGPTALFIASAIIIGWSVAQITTRRTGILAVLLVLIASPGALSIFMAAVSHNTVYPCTALLGAYLVWLAKGDGRGRKATLIVPVLAAIILGVCLASDVLLVPAGVFPFALTALIACLRRDRRSKLVALYALGTVAFAVPIAMLTSAIMFSQGYRTNAPPLKLAPLSTFSAHAQLLLEGLKRLFNGYLNSTPHSPLQAGLGMACDVVMALALLTLLLLGARSVVRFIVSGLRAKQSQLPRQVATDLHVIYWVSSAIAVCGAFAFSSFLDSTHEAFYVTVIFSVAAVIPLLVHSRVFVRWLVPIGISIFFAASLVGLTSKGIWGLGVWLPRYEADMLKVAHTYNATTGYTGFWDASSLTWSSDERLKARPVFACQHPEGANLCVFSQDTVAAWYVPKRRNTFLVVEPGEYYVNSLPAGLGRPLAAYNFGKVYMFIYPYDIASRLGPSSSQAIGTEIG